MKASTVPVKAKQGAEAREWSWVEASIWTERMVSALVNGVEGGKWYSLMDKVYAPKTLALAWDRVRANQGAAGVDGQSVERFQAQADRYLAELSRDLREGSYRPEAVKRVEIPTNLQDRRFARGAPKGCGIGICRMSGNGQIRPLGIPTVKDRIVQTAVKLVIEPIFEAQFLASSYGFRPGRGCKDALREVDRLLKEGYTHVVDADLKGYFGAPGKARRFQRVRFPPRQGEEPPHREPSLGLMKVTTWVKRRQGDTRAVTQVKPNEPRDKEPEADKLEYLEGHEKPAARGDGGWRFRRGLRARHEWKRKRQRNLGDPSRSWRQVEYAD